MVRIGVLVSGSGSNLQSIIDACEDKDIDAQVSIVISNLPGVYALERAQVKGIPTKVVAHAEHPNRENYDEELVKILKGYKVDLVVLAGFMRVLTPSFLGAFPGMIMNIHPALLPSFPGLHAQRQAVEHGVKISGVTVHLVDTNLDAGPIVMQAAVPVFDDDTEDALADRILAEEHRIYPEAIQRILDGGWVIEGRRIIVGQTTAGA